MAIVEYLRVWLHHRERSAEPDLSHGSGANFVERARGVASRVANASSASHRLPAKAPASFESTAEDSRSSSVPSPVNPFPLAQASSSPQSVQDRRLSGALAKSSVSTLDLSATALVSRNSSQPVSPTSSHMVNSEAMEAFMLQAEAYIRAAQWEQARIACDAAVSVAPDVAVAHKRVGNLYQEAGKEAEALGFYGYALLFNPEYPEVFANLGSLCARQGKWERAEAYYRKAIALRPDFAPFYKPLARVLEASGRLQESTDVFAQAVALEPEASGREHYRAAQLFLDQGDEAKAIESFRKAVDAEESCLEACQPLADLLEKQGDWQAATTYYRKAFEAGLEPQSSEGQETGSSSGGNAAKLARQPSSKGYAVTRISARSQQQPAQLRGRRMKVIRSQAPQQAQKNGALPPATERSVPTQAEPETLQDAIAIYQASLKADPNQPEVYRSLARALTQTNQREDAIQAWFQAFRLEPDWATAKQHYNLASNLADQGKLKEAAYCYGQAVRLQPEFAEAYEGLGKVLELQNDAAGAATAYRKASELKGAVAVKK